MHLGLCKNSFCGWNSSGWFSTSRKRFILTRTRLSLLVKVSKVYIFIICSRVTQVNIWDGIFRSSLFKRFGLKWVHLPKKGNRLTGTSTVRRQIGVPRENRKSLIWFRHILCFRIVYGMFWTQYHFGFQIELTIFTILVCIIQRVNVQFTFAWLKRFRKRRASKNSKVE